MGPSATAASAGAFLSIRGLRKVYGDFVALDDLDLDIRKGELVAFLGPSGCGKTTSLRLIAGLSPATAGRIVVGGRDLTRAPPYRRDMGIVFQSYALFPHLTVARNVAFGLEMRKVPRAEIAARVADAIAMVRLTGREGRRPAELSGGQQQRVALARALVIQPTVLLFDEPLSNLDAKLRDDMRTEIRDIQQRLGITAIFVTHDQVEALTMCDRVAVMNSGRLEQLGTPEDLYERPKTAFVAAFVGRTNRIPGTASGTELMSGPLRLRSQGSHVQGLVEIMVRPHRIAIRPAGTGPEVDPTFNRASGVVVRSTYAGDVIQTEVDLGGALLSVEQSTVAHEHTQVVGQKVDLSWSAADTLVFPAGS